MKDSTVIGQLKVLSLYVTNRFSDGQTQSGLLREMKLIYVTIVSINGLQVVIARAVV